MSLKLCLLSSCSLSLMMGKLYLNFLHLFSYSQVRKRSYIMHRISCFSLLCLVTRGHLLVGFIYSYLTKVIFSLLPLQTPKTLKQQYLTSLSVIWGIIVFGGLIAPTVSWFLTSSSFGSCSSPLRIVLDLLMVYCPCMWVAVSYFASPLHPKKLMKSGNLITETKMFFLNLKSSMIY